MPGMRFAAAARQRGMPGLRPRAAYAAVDLGAAAPVALCPSLSPPAVGRFFADAGLYRGDAGAALPDDSADGRHPDPVPERPADRGLEGLGHSGRPAGCGAAGLGPELG